MTAHSNRSLIVLVLTCAILVAFVAFNALSGAAVRGVRLDLTQNRLYTLSPGVKPLLKRLGEPVALDFYYTSSIGQSVPALHTYAQRVREFLDELVAGSNGNLTLRVIDPQPYSEEEDAAVIAGLAPLQIDGSGRTLTLGLVARNRVDKQETIAFLDPSKEPFLEYDVVRLIETVGRTSRAKIGLLTSLQMQGGFNPANPQRPAPPWQVLEQMQSFFEIVTVRDALPPAAGAEATPPVLIPDDLAALMIVHPKGLSEAMLRAIDAFALRGGRLLVFLDPVCEAEPVPQGQQGFGADRTSNLGGLPQAWGIDWTTDKIVGDRTYALKVQTRGRNGPQVIDYLPWLALDGTALDRDDPVTGKLSRIHLATAAAIDVRAGNSSIVVPLMRSSAESMRIESMRVAMMPDPQGLLSSFVASGKRESLAVRITGTIGSAFAPTAAPAVEQGEGAPPPAPMAGPTQSAPANIIVVGDADCLGDDQWISEERLGPISLGWRTIADNGAFVLNALEMLTGDDAMLGLRGRGPATRPFERVEALRKSAETQYLAREKSLQEEIGSTQQKIDELQRAKAPGEQLILSAEQEKELDSLEQSVLAARKELRQVQFNLRASVESLGRRLMVFNVVMWPLVVALLALAWSLRRSRSAGGRGFRAVRPSAGGAS